MHLCIIINPPSHPTSISHIQVDPQFTYLVHKPTYGGHILHRLHSTTCTLSRPSHTSLGNPFLYVLSKPIFLYSFRNCIKNLFFINFIYVGHISNGVFPLEHKNPCHPWLGHPTCIIINSNYIYRRQNPTYHRHPFPKPLYFDLSYIPLQYYPFNTVHLIFSRPTETRSCFTVVSIIQYTPNQGNFLSLIYP